MAAQQGGGAGATAVEYGDYGAGPGSGGNGQGKAASSTVDCVAGRWRPSSRWACSCLQGDDLIQYSCGVGQERVVA